MNEIFNDPIRDNVYSLFVEYFTNPSMTKIKDVDDYSMYISKVYAILGIEYRYIIVFVPKDNKPFNTVDLLSNLKWVSLQTRSLTDNHSLSYHSYIPKRLASLDKKITLLRKDNNQYLYNVEALPITIILLPKNIEKNVNQEYSPSGTVVTAMETYQTIVTFKN